MLSPPCVLACRRFDIFVAIRVSSTRSAAWIGAYTSLLSEEETYGVAWPDSAGVSYSSFSLGADMMMCLPERRHSKLAAQVRCSLDGEDDQINYDSLQRKGGRGCNDGNNLRYSIGRTRQTPTAFISCVRARGTANHVNNCFIKVSKQRNCR